MVSDSRDGASSGQAETHFPPAIQPAGLYTRNQIIANMHLTDASFRKTLARGERQGKPLRPLPICTKTHWFSASQFITWLESLDPEDNDEQEI